MKESAPTRWRAAACDVMRWEAALPGSREFEDGKVAKIIIHCLPLASTHPLMPNRTPLSPEGSNPVPVRGARASAPSVSWSVSWLLVWRCLQLHETSIKRCDIPKSQVFASSDSVRQPM
jgi:hypothetical protein